MYEVVSNAKHISPHVPPRFAVILAQFPFTKLHRAVFHDLPIRAVYPSSETHILAHFCIPCFFFIHRFGRRTAGERGDAADGLRREQCTSHGKSAASTANGIDSVRRRHVTYRCGLVADPIKGQTLPITRNRETHHEGSI